MSYIHTIQVGETNYLIEPFLYAETSGTSTAYTTTITNYDKLANTILFLHIHTANTGTATLSINSDTAAPIKYQGNAVEAGQLRQGYTYILTYANSAWNILNDISVLSVAANGGLEFDSNGLLQIASGGVTGSMIAAEAITDAKIADNAAIDISKLAYSSITIEGHEVSLGGTLSLGLSNAMHFVGIVSNQSTYTPADGTHPTNEETLVITGLNSYTPANGDIIFDNGQLREYIYSNGNWYLLGLTTSQLWSLTTSGNEWIASVSQNTDGTISATKRSLDTSGLWSGNAATLGLIDNITNDIPDVGDSTHPVYFHAGLPAQATVYGGGTRAKLNRVANDTNYDTDIELYAPTESGTQYEILISNVHTENSTTLYEPKWSTTAHIIDLPVANSERTTTVLELGNTTTTEGIINLFSAGGESHIIQGQSTSNQEYTHILPNGSGYLALASLGGAGGPNQPIYISSSGVTTPLVFTPHRLYYSEYSVAEAATNPLPSDASEFVPTNHFANTTKIAINSTSEPTVNLYVDGTTYLDSYTGIGTAPDSTSTYILKLLGSTLIDGAATLTSTTANNQTYLSFEPVTPNTGYIGTTTNQWYSGAFYHDITIDVGFEATSSGTLTLSAQAPIITLETTTANAHTWTITNSSGTWILTNNDATSAIDLIGSPNGFKIDGRLYINEAIPANPTLDLYVNGTSELLGAVGIGTPPAANAHILKILGSTLITDAATLTSITSNNQTYLDFEPVTANTGHIGTTTKQWYSGAFYHDITIDAGFAAGSDGTLVLSAQAPIITLETTTANKDNWTMTNNQGNWILSNGNNLSEVSLTGQPNGFELQSRLYINDTIPSNPSLDLYVNGTSELFGRVGIGMEPDSASSGDQHILSIQGSTVIYDASTDIIHIDLATVSNATVPQIYPTTSATGSIGLDAHRWNSIYTSNLLDIADSTSSILLSVNDSNPSAPASVLTMTSTAPVINLDTTTTSASNWRLYNNSGDFQLNNNSTTEFKGVDDGFSIAPRLYINTSVPAQNQDTLYVDGTTVMTESLTMSGTTASTALITFSSTSTPNYINVPANAGLGISVDGADTTKVRLYVDNTSVTSYTDNSVSLGTSSVRWSSLFVGTADTYGDAYTPIYWLNGIPVAIDVVQKIPWTMNNTHKSVTITAPDTGVFTDKSIVIQIVVESGQSYLSAPLTWKSGTNWVALNTEIAVTGTVQGYILVIRGVEMSSSYFTYTRSTSEV